MPLTHEECEFLGPVFAENADVRIGPAWAILNERGIRNASLIWLIEAYKYVNPPRLVAEAEGDGTIVEKLVFGHTRVQLPPCPWPDDVVAESRNREIAPEVLALREAARKERCS